MERINAILQHAIDDAQKIENVLDTAAQNLPAKVDIPISLPLIDALQRLLLLPSPSCSVVGDKPNKTKEFKQDDEFADDAKVLDHIIQQEIDNILQKISSDPNVSEKLLNSKIPFVLSEVRPRKPQEFVDILGESQFNQKEASSIKLKYYDWRTIILKLHHCLVMPRSGPFLKTLISELVEDIEEGKDQFLRSGSGHDSELDQSLATDHSSLGSSSDPILSKSMDRLRRSSVSREGRSLSSMSGDNDEGLKGQSRWRQLKEQQNNLRDKKLSLNVKNVSQSPLSTSKRSHPSTASGDEEEEDLFHFDMDLSGDAAPSSAGASEAKTRRTGPAIQGSMDSSVPAGRIDDSPHAVSSALSINSNRRASHSDAHSMDLYGSSLDSSVSSFGSSPRSGAGSLPHFVSRMGEAASFSRANVPTQPAITTTASLDTSVVPAKAPSVAPLLIVSTDEQQSAISPEKPDQESVVPKKRKHKKVPYSGGHQIVFPASFYRYTDVDEVPNPQIIEFAKQLKQKNFKSWPHWLSFSVCLSPVRKDTSESIQLPLKSAMVIINSQGHYDPLLEQYLCQEISRLISNKIAQALEKSDATVSEEMLVKLVSCNENLRKSFPAFTSIDDLICKFYKSQVLELYEELQRCHWTEDHLNEVTADLVTAFQKDYELSRQPRPAASSSSSSSASSSSSSAAAAGSEAAPSSAVFDLLQKLEIERDLYCQLRAGDVAGLYHMEKILVALLGYNYDSEVCDAATRWLNQLYDGHNWQHDSAFQPKIRCIGDRFVIEFNISRLPYYRHGSEDQAELDERLQAMLDEIYVEISAPNPLQEGASKITRPYVTYHKPVMQRGMLVVTLPDFHRAGYYDWRLVTPSWPYFPAESVKFSSSGSASSADLILPPSATTSIIPFHWRYPEFCIVAKQDETENNAEEMINDKPKLQLHQLQGRYIVQPPVRNETIHEVLVDIEGATWDRERGSQVYKRGTFETVRNALDDYARNDCITSIYMMGALDRADFGQGHPFAPVDRAFPNSASGGVRDFTRLLEKANQMGVKLLVDATPKISVKGYHRKYRKMTCTSIDQSGIRHATLATDGSEHVWEDCCLVNFRKLQSWDLFIRDIESWAQRGIQGVRVDCAHCCPLMLPVNLPEMLRRDSDGQMHYTNEEILDGYIVNEFQPQLPNGGFSEDMRHFGYFGTKAYREGYPNPFFIKTTRRLWDKFPTFTVFAEIYWNREWNAIRSGLIPYSSGLPQAVQSVFGTGIDKDGRACYLQKKRSVEVLYDWYTKERDLYPQNSITLYASATHYTPYPITLYGVGAWSTVDLLYFLPEVPCTFVGEHAGWWMPYNILRNEFYPVPMLGGTGNRQLHEIRGHYVHRAKLRQRLGLFREGGMMLLYARYCVNSLSNDDPWHDRVFAFSRFKYKKLAVVAINFNDVDSHFYIDLEPLREICGPDEKEATQKRESGYDGLSPVFSNIGCIFRRVDLINPTNQPVYFSLQELLYEKQFISLRPYESLSWGIFREPASPATHRVLFEHSLQRLMNNLEAGNDPNHNLIYSMLVEALETSCEKLVECIDQLQRQLPAAMSSTFAKLLHRVFHRYAIQHNAEERIVSMLTTLVKREQEKMSKFSGGGLGGLGGGMFRGPGSVFHEILQLNTLGPIVFVTPEIGRFSTVGGIGVMVNELTQALVQLGCTIIVVSPYYNYNRNGETGYLTKEGAKWLQNVVTFIGPERVEVGIHELYEEGIHYYFIHSFDYFPSPYHAGSAQHQLKTIVLMAKASLELCCQLRLLPAVVVTNDWFTGLVPAYGKSTGAFGTVFSGTTFFHIIHNLEHGYEGKIYLDGYDDLGYIHNLPRDIVVDEGGSGPNQVCLNASRAALMMSDQWGTVSQSYREDLMGETHPSPLRHLLRRYPSPFAYSNGIRVIQRRKVLKSVAPSHDEAKRLLQEKYFPKNVNPVIPLFSFVGRVCLQKGVHLILGAVRELIRRYSGRIQFIVGGPANKKDPYANQCAWQMEAWRNTYPDNFWANPNEFFMDGPLVNLGSDFALMPSLFEPSGVVQQEYFAAGTPVIAFKTGGLKDTVFEGNPDPTKNNGFTFEAHAHKDFVDAISRAMAVFSQPQQYQQLRQNAYNSVLDMQVVANEWAKEFSRLRKVMWVPKPNEEQEGEGSSSSSSSESADKSAAPAK